MSHVSVDCLDIPLIVGIIGLIGAIFAAVLAYRTALRRVREDLEIDFDTNLRSLRIKTYRKLWCLTKPFARYPKPKLLSYQAIDIIALSLRDWYFDDGGLFLSEEAREYYFNFLDAFKIIMEKLSGDWPTHLGVPIDRVELRLHLGRAKDWLAPDDLAAIASWERDEFSEQIPDDVSEKLRGLGSSLRTAITQDVFTRRYLSRPSKSVGGRSNGDRTFEIP
jgi:hypothetical protein